MKILVGTDIESVQRFKILVKSEKNLVKNIFFESEYNYAISKVSVLTAAAYSNLIPIFTLILSAIILV